MGFATGALRGRPLPAEGYDCFFPAVEELRRRIEPVWPDDRPSVIVDSDLLEVVEVLQRLAERSMQQEGAVDDAYDPVVELDLEPVAVKWLDCCDFEHRVDVTEAVRSRPAVPAPAPDPSSSPARRDEASPIRAPGAAPASGANHSTPPVSSRRSARSALRIGMEVRRRMVGPVHVDHDSVERRQTRHSAIVDGDPAPVTNP